MPNYDELTASLNTKLKHLEQQRDEVLRDLDAISRVKQLTTQMSNRPRQSVVPAGDDIAQVDVAQCKSHMEAAILIAEANDGVISISNTAKVIKTAGISIASNDNLKSNISRMLNKSNRWKRIELGMYRYLGAADNDPVYGDLTVDDINQCNSHMEAAIVMARSSDGILLIKDASEMIAASGLSRAKPKGVASSLHTALKGHHLWEHVGPGLFRYVGDQQLAEADADEHGRQAVA